MTKPDTSQAYDPLEYDNLARNVVQALMEQPCQNLPPIPFKGVGVYALYNVGSLDCYKAMRSEDIPIYVGSAVLAGKRKGSGDSAAGRTLQNRLAQHAKSIQQAENLRLEDFRCRFLVVVPVWIELAQRFLIEHYRPVWNTVVDGFGNHDPGAGRKDMKRPRWDILHPGRGWAKRLKPAETPAKIIADIKPS
jgi:hypothetical protein